MKIGQPPSDSSNLAGTHTRAPALRQKESVCVCLCPCMFPHLDRLLLRLLLKPSWGSDIQAGTEEEQDILTTEGKEETGHDQSKHKINAQPLGCPVVWIIKRVAPDEDLMCSWSLADDELCINRLLQLITCHSATAQMEKDYWWQENNWDPSMKKYKDKNEWEPDENQSAWTESLFLERMIRKRSGNMPCSLVLESQTFNAG